MKYLLAAQREDGSWYGSWAICFTYAMMFALETLSAMGLTHDNSYEVRRACDFLVSKQNEDGGWGEAYKVCVMSVACVDVIFKTIIFLWGVTVL